MRKDSWSHLDFRATSFLNPRKPLGLPMYLGLGSHLGWPPWWAWKAPFQDVAKCGGNQSLFRKSQVLTHLSQGSNVVPSLTNVLSIQTLFKELSLHYLSSWNEARELSSTVPFRPFIQSFTNNLQAPITLHKNFRFSQGQEISSKVHLEVQSLREHQSPHEVQYHMAGRSLSSPGLWKATPEALSQPVTQSHLNNLMTKNLFKHKVFEKNFSGPAFSSLEPPRWVYLNPVWTCEPQVWLLVVVAICLF